MRFYLSIELGQARSVVRALEHKEYPDLMWRSRVRRSPDVTVEENQVGGGGVFRLGA